MEITEQAAIEQIWEARQDVLRHRDAIDELLTRAKLAPDKRDKLTRVAKLLEQAHTILNNTA